MKRLTAWLAVAAMALNALWPLLAHAGPAEFSAPVCTTSATAEFTSPAGTLPAPPAKLNAPHCPFCGGAGVFVFAAPPAVVGFVPVEYESPARDAAASPQAFELFRAPPRGPPVSLLS